MTAVAVGVWRITDRTTFNRLRREGIRRRRGAIGVTFIADGSPQARVAYAIGRSAGTAVVRNRLRRRLRALVAELDLPPGAYLVSAAREARTLDPATLADQLVHAIRAATATEST